MSTANRHRHSHDEPAPLEFVELPDSDLTSWRPDLEPGAGRERILYLDAASGIAGDMFIAACVDMGVPWSVVVDAVKATGLNGFQLALRHGRAGAIGACQLDVEVTALQDPRSWRDIQTLLDRSQLSAPILQTARAIFSRLAEAEARVHRLPASEVHFHEVGAVDSIVDIVGAAAIFEYLQADVVSSPLPLGRGFVDTDHGPLPLPAPATLECLRGIPTQGTDLEAEMVTPTGAAIVASKATRFSAWPALRPAAIGWGAGHQVLRDRPNVLRAVLGEGTDHERDTTEPPHVLLQANVDDMTGELAGYVLARLMDQGALDAWTVPTTTKKGRPGLVISALASPDCADRIAELMLAETTTLGIRRHDMMRITRPRETLQIETRYGRVPVKVARGPYGPAQIKPEFDACATIAEQSNTPVREVIAEVLTKARLSLGVDHDR